MEVNKMGYTFAVLNPYIENKNDLLKSSLPHTALGLYVHTTALGTFDFYTQCIDTEKNESYGLALEELELVSKLMY